MSLLEEKVQLFRGMWEGSSPVGEEISRPLESFLRSACSQELPRGASIMKDALQEGKKSQQRVCFAQWGLWSVDRGRTLALSQQTLMTTLYNSDADHTSEDGRDMVAPHWIEIKSQK